MSEELRKFLKFLYEADTGYVYSPLKRKTGEWEQRFFQWPSEVQALEAWIDTSSLEGNVYVAPGLFSEKKATKDSFKHSNVAWVEFDGATKIDFKDIPNPDVIVQTSSETHTHCYWKIRPANGETVENVNRRLTYYFRADNSGWDCTQVLRPPGTLNHKYSKPLETKLIKFKPSLIKRDFATFDLAPEIEKPPLIIKYEDLAEASELVAKLKLPEDLIKMVMREMAVPPNRSTFLMRLGYLLASHGVDELDTVSLLYHADSRIKKFVGRSDQLMRLAEIASIAQLEVSKELHVEGYSPSEIIKHELELQWRIDGWLHSYGILILTGQPGVGKTQFAMDLAHKLGTGDSVLGKSKKAPVKVAVLSLEMDIIEIKYIFVAQNKVFGKDENASLWNDNVKVFAPEEDSSGFGAYEKILKEFRPEILIIDSLSELASDDLKESEARSIMRWLKRMSREYECGIIIIHHNRKASDGNKKPRKLGDLYGSYIFAKTVSTVVSLWHEDAKEYIEVDDLKVRFGEKKSIKVKRTEHLTFDLYEEKIDANRQQRTVSGKVDTMLKFI